MNDVLLTVSEAAERLGIGRTMMFQLIKNGEVKVIKFGRATRVPASELNLLIQRQLKKEKSV